MRFKIYIKYTYIYKFSCKYFLDGIADDDILDEGLIYL